MYQMTDEKKARIADLCRRHHVRRLDFFGSAAGSDFDPSRSDLDVLVEFEVLGEGKYADAWFICTPHSRSSSRTVDLVSATSVNNPYFRAELERTRRLCGVKPPSRCGRPGVGGPITRFVGDRPCRPTSTMSRAVGRRTRARGDGRRWAACEPDPDVARRVPRLVQPAPRPPAPPVRRQRRASRVDVVKTRIPPLREALRTLLPEG